MIKEQQALSGRLRINIVDSRGKLIGYRQNNNKIVADGRQLVASLFAGNTTMSTIAFFGIGTDINNTPTNDADTGLKQEVAINVPDNKRKALTSTAIVPGPGINQWTVEVHGVLSMAESNGVIITEVGLFNFEDIGSAATDAYMYNRVVFQQIEKTSLFELQFFWEIIF